MRKADLRLTADFLAVRIIRLKIKKGVVKPLKTNLAFRFSHGFNNQAMADNNWGQSEKPRRTQWYYLAPDLLNSNHLLKVPHAESRN